MTASALDWIGMTRRDSFNPMVLDARDRLAAAVRAGEWRATLAILRERPELANAWAPDDASWRTPLHEAAAHGAPERIVRELVKLGAWRTLRTANGERAVDLATAHGHAAIARLLEPELRAPIERETLRALEVQFHAVMRSRAAHEIDAIALRLPDLGPMTEFPVGQVFWCPVPGMYGGFRYELERAGDAPLLIAESWCRVVGGSGQRHRITPDGFELLDSGFV